ncbi:MAG: hypothetical protein ACJA0Q_000649 [Saprospiraceae bacterium]|jgi:hypothetical protein
MLNRVVHVFFTVFFITLISGSGSVQAQNTDRLALQNNMYRYTLINGDTIPIIDLPVCVVGKYGRRPTFRNRRKQKRYNRLEKRVKKVYPYAQLAAAKLKEYEPELALLHTEKERRKVMKKVEQALKDEYGKELKNLTVSQGKILLKLIDRQTGRTSYELVKQMRGSFSVAMWQGLALLFGQNLKSQYSANGEDKWIEFIVRRIELGAL